MSRGHFIGLNHHQLMLRDKHRMQTYEQAICDSVKPGDVVVDIGTGTGILALWAARAGARKVYAIEPHDVIHVAERIAAENGVTNIEFIKADSRKVSLPEPADVAVTEAMGNFFVTDEMQPVLRDIPRHLKAGARVIPSQITMYLAPVWLPLWSGGRFWTEPIGGFDFSSALSIALNQSYVMEVEPEFLIGPAVQWKQFPLIQAPDRVEGTAELPIEKSNTLHGILGWFDAQLTTEVLLTTAPGQRTHWGQMLFPIEPISVQAGDSIALEMALEMDDDYRWIFRWQGSHERDGFSIDGFVHDSRQRFGAQTD